MDESEVFYVVCFTRAGPHFATSAAGGETLNFGRVWTRDIAAALPFGSFEEARVFADELYGRVGRSHWVPAAPYEAMSASDVAARMLSL